MADPPKPRPVPMGSLVTGEEPPPPRLPFALGHTPTPPADPVGDVLADHEQMRQQAADAFARGDYTTGLSQFAQWSLTHPAEALRQGVTALGSKVSQAVSPYFTPPLDVQETGRQLQAYGETQLPATGEPLVDAMSWPHRMLPQLAFEQLASSTTPGGAALNLPMSGAAAVAPIVLARRAAARTATQPITRAGIQELLSGLSVQQAPKVAKEIVIPEGLGNLGKILTRGEPGTRSFPHAPAAAERVESIFNIGRSLPRRAEWSSVMDPEILYAFENDPEIAKTYGSLWAALSNQNPVPTDTAESVQVWLHRLQHPAEFPLHHTRLRQMPYQNVNLSPSKYGNVNRAFMGEPLSGPKVRPMEAYMRGEGTGFETMTPDVHALYGSGVTRANPAIAQELPHIRALVSQTERLKRGALTEDELVEVWQNSLYDILHRLDPERTPDQVFGDFWEGARAHKGKPFQGSVKDILRDRGLLEYGAMLDQRKLLAALRRKGPWSVGGLLALTAMIGTEQEAATAGSPPPPPPAF